MVFGSRVPSKVQIQITFPLPLLGTDVAPKVFLHHVSDHVILHCLFIRAFPFTFGTVFLIAENGQMILLLVFLQQLLHQKASFTFITWRHQVLSCDVLVNIFLGCEPSSTVATGRCFVSISHVPLQLRLDIFILQIPHSVLWNISMCCTSTWEDTTLPQTAQGTRGSS